MTANEKYSLRNGLAALLLLVMLTLFYPDTFIDTGFVVAGVRLSPLALIFFLTAPFIAVAAWASRHSLKPRLVDLFLFVTISIVVLNGFMKAGSVNEQGLVLAYAAYVIVVYYGTALITKIGYNDKIIYWTLALCATVISVYALVEFLLGENIIFGQMTTERVATRPGDYHRSSSTLAHPVALGIIMVQLLPFTFYQLLRSRDIRWKLFWSASLLLGIFALLTSFSKGSWITAAFLGLILVIIMVREQINWKRQVIMATVLLVVAGGSFIYRYENQFIYNLASRERVDDSYSNRLFLWKRAPEVFVRHPVIGVGLQRAGEAVFDETFSDKEKAIGRPVALDNLYITTLVEGGIIGGLAALITIILLIRQAVVVVGRDARARVMALPLVFSIAAVIINGFTTDSLLIWAPMVVFWLCAGMIRALYEQEARADE